MADLPRFDLGQAGLVLTSSPLHGDQGQMTKAQNVEFKRVQGLGGMGSRTPLTAFSKNLLATMTGDVLSACAVPLPSPLDDLTLPIILLATTTGWLISTGGSFTLVTLTVPPSGVGITTAGGLTGYVGPYDGTKTTVVVDGKPVDVPGYVADIAGHPNGRFYVSVVNSTIAYSGIQNAGGWNGGQFDNATMTATNRVQGKVLEISAEGVVLRQIGENFGIDNTAQTALPAGSPPYTTFPTGSSEDGRSDAGGSDNLGRGPLGGAPAGLSVGTSGRLYVVFGSYYLNLATGVHTPPLDLYQGVDYLSIEPDTETTWSVRKGGGAIGVSRTRFDNLGSPTSGPGEILADAMNADDPWFAGVSADPFTVSSSLGVDSGDIGGSCVFSNGTAGNLKIFGDPDAATIGGFAYWVGLIKFAGSIYVAYYTATNPGSDPGKIKIYKTASNDASTLTLDHNVLTSISPAPPSTHVYPGQPYTFDDGGGAALYWPFYGLPGHTSSGFVLKRTSGGVWTVHDFGLSDLTGASVAYAVEV